MPCVLRCVYLTIFTLTILRIFWRYIFSVSIWRYKRARCFNSVFSRHQRLRVDRCSAIIISDWSPPRSQWEKERETRLRFCERSSLSHTYIRAHVYTHVRTYARTSNVAETHPSVPIRKSVRSCVYGWRPSALRCVAQISSERSRDPYLRPRFFVGPARRGWLHHQWQQWQQWQQ